MMMVHEASREISAAIHATIPAAREVRVERTTVDGLTVFFDADERDAAELIGRASAQSAELITRLWGLETPGDCRVYVMTSWFRFLFHSAPPYLWPVLVLLMPFWLGRVRQLWRVAGGWAQRWGRRRAVGVKPPRLMEIADTSIGSRIFVKGENIEEKVENVTCHELVHAFSGHLRLPMWLNEGLAMVTVDRYLEKQTVRGDTLDLVERWTGERDPARYRKMRITSPDAIVYHYARGYWITRYLEETRPELLEELLRRRSGNRRLERRVASAFEMKPPEFWRTIDATVVNHFRRESASQTGSKE
jgi:hypothetical protein